MKTINWRLFVPVIAAALVLTGCENEEQTKRIKELEEEVQQYIAEAESISGSLQEAAAERDKLQSELNQAQRAAKLATSELAHVRRELESTRKTEEKLRDSARSKAASQPAEASKKSIGERLSAVWLVEGDKTSCHGVAAEADGKTWLYLPANALGGSSRLTITDAGGNTVTKFGEFQVAADANLARLEIKQDVPTRFVVDPKAVLGEKPRLIFASPAPDGSTPKLTDTVAETVTSTDLEFNAYSLNQAEGYPVFAAESGAFIGLILPPSQTATGLWDDPQTTQTGSPRAALLNRTIEWKASSIGALLAERRKIDELNNLSKLLFAAATLTPGATGIQMEAMVSDGNQSAEQIFQANKDMPVVQELYKLNSHLAAQKVRVSESDIKRQVSRITGNLSSAARRVASELRAMKPDPSNRQDVENALKWHDEAAKKLAESPAESGR